MSPTTVFFTSNFAQCTIDGVCLSGADKPSRVCLGLSVLISNMFDEVDFIYRFEAVNLFCGYVFERFPGPRDA